ncbi:MAG: hypothetical protein JWR85_4210 [Marmoricola sp.]|nr:hypothetical protein [Marmoricola sp.]
MADKTQSVILSSNGPTKAEQERATEFWDRLHAEERARKQLRQGDPEKWPFPSSGYDTKVTADKEKLAGAWGTPVQRLDNADTLLAGGRMTAEDMAGAVTSESLAKLIVSRGTIAPPAAKPSLESWGKPAAVLPANMEAEQDKRSFSPDDPATKPTSVPASAWGDEPWGKPK